MKSSFLAILLALAPLAALAQQPPSPDNDPISRYLIPPELVMSQSEQIGLNEKQRATIKGEIQKMQAKFIDAQWDLQEQTGKMTHLLQQSPADEARILEQADKIMALEREIKRAHLALLVRIKNALTTEQIAKLEAMRRGK
ncbi:MAG TPA: periplasmic heavy metal sensor [Thermoanaerobaculia bacterium]|nr:periplasmic heavy metal sensor [Thermoanaerobaculia bacterium]